MAQRLSPETTFLFLGSTCGLLFLFVTPPFQVPDEPQYFYRAFQISELRFLDNVYLNSGAPAPGAALWLGTQLPKSLALLVNNSDLVKTRFKPDSKLNPAKVFAGIQIPLNPAEREYLPIAPYSPASFLPQAIGIAVGRILGQPPLVLFYLGRLGALAAWIAFVFFAIKNTPILKWAYVLLALMPMTLYLAASNSGDSFVIGTGFLITATLLKWIYDDTQKSVRRCDLAGLGVLAVGISLSKAIYLVVLLLFILVPVRKFKNRTEYAVAGCLIVIKALVAYFIWNFSVGRAMPGPSVDLSVHAIDAEPFSNIAPREQLKFVSANPVAFFGVIQNTAEALWLFHFSSFFGLLGWLDTILPVWLPFVYAVTLIAAARLSSSKSRITSVARLISVMIFGLTLLISLLYIYVVGNPVGAELIRGYQGRYLIPASPVLFLLFHSNKQGQNAKSISPGVTTIGCILFALVMTSIAAYRVIARFYW